MEDLQLNFFDFTKPCPAEIPNCENLRLEYQNELKKYLKENVCNTCVERSIRNKYTTFILALANK